MHALNRPSHRLMGVTAAACLALALGLAGCQQTSGDDARVAELEQQVEDLQAQLDDQGAASASQGTSSDDAGASGSSAGTGTASSDQALDADLTAAYPELADFEGQVADLEATCQNVQVSDDRNANYQTFIGAKQQIEAVEHAMDNYDENQEAAARAGTLSYDEYMRIERAVDYLDERLDHAKDGMEYTLGIDD